MTEAARRITRFRIRIIKIQWLIILVLLAALIISLVTRPAASVDIQTPATETPAASSEVILPEETLESLQETTFEPELIELGEFRTTAYCTCVICCGIWSRDHPSRLGTDYVQKTASGTIPTAGRTVAADTSVLPFGTVLVIDGHEYIVEDRGSAVNGNTIDIYFDSHEDAVAYGVQYKTIYIKGE